jgi:penicillin-binding protein 1A
MVPVRAGRSLAEEAAAPEGVLPGRRPRRRRLRFLWRIAAALLVLAVAAFGVGWLVTPSVSDAPARVATTLRNAHDPALRSLPTPDRVGRAVIATEDSRFYVTPGIDPLGVFRAFLGPAFGMSSAGATIDQQLAKLLYTAGDASFAAKFEDVELAVKLDVHFSKPRILLMYLNDVYFGHGYTGVRAAARGYFGREPGQLDWAQAALLAGLIQAPTAYDPYAHYEDARARQRHVLDRLVATGVISAAAANAYYREPLHLVRR